MEGQAVVEIATRTAKPTELDLGVLAVPSGWTLQHKDSVRPTAPPKATALEVSTLGALRDYLKENRDGLDLSKVICHIETPQRVTVSSVLRGESRDRELYIAATTKDLLADFLGKFHSQQEMVIALQTRFVEDSGARANVLRVIGTIREDQVTTSNDDGMTQQVTAAAGTVLVQSTTLPNPVALNAYRTFRDIGQPLVPYVLRAKAGQNGNLPTVALFEADGGEWQLSSIADIHLWLIDNLPAGVAVLA